MDEQQRLQHMWQELRKDERLSEQTFIECSNALLEWNVKNVRLPKDFEVLLRYNLGQYGMLKDFGESIQKVDKLDWRIAVNHVDEVVKQIKLREIEDMEAQFDNELLLRLRLAHDKLHCLLDVSELQSIPVREMIYCLAVFLLTVTGERKYEMFKLLLLPVDVVNFLRSVVMTVKSRTDDHTTAVNKVTKKQFRMLRKCCKQVEELYILDASYQDVDTVGALDNAIISDAMLSHITSKLDKLVSSTVCTIEGLRKLSKEMNEIYHYAIKNERPDNDLKLFYRKLLHNLPLLKALLGLDLFLRIMVAYQRFMWRIGQCRTFKQMRLLSSYIYNIAQINEYHERLYQSVAQFYLNSPCPEGSDQNHSYKIKTLNELKNWLISTTSVRLDQIVYLMETNTNLDRLKNLIHFDLSTISDRISTKVIQTLWSNVDLEKQHVNSTEVLLASLDSSVSGDAHDDHQLINPPELEDLPQMGPLPNNENDFLPQNMPDIDEIMQTFSRLTSEAARICKDRLFSEPVSEIKQILAEQKCSTVEEISRNFNNLAHHARIQLRYRMAQILQHLKHSKRLVNEAQMLRAGHEMIYGQMFLDFLENDLPSYRAMVSDSDLNVLLSALLVTEVLYEDVFSGMNWSQDVSKLTDIGRYGLSWVQIQQDLLEACNNFEEGKISRLIADGANLNGEYFGLLGKYGKYKFYGLENILSNSFPEFSEKHNLASLISESHIQFDSKVHEIKLALKAGRYNEVLSLSGQQIYSFEEELFGWESLGYQLNNSDFRSLHEKKEAFLYVVEKLVIHANVQSLEVMLKSQSHYIPQDSLLIKSIQSGCEDLFHLLVRRKNIVEESVTKMAISAHMHQYIMPSFYEHSDETFQIFLQTAIQANNVQLMEMLSSRPFITPILSTVLPISVQFNRLKIVQIILNRYVSADINTLLFSAACHKHWAMCRLLIQRGANPHARVDSPGPYVTSCQLAIVGNCTNIVKEWAKIGANGIRDLGYLTLAASTGSVKMVRVLLKAGFSIIDEHHLFPLVWSNGQEDLKKVLIDGLIPDWWITAVDEVGAWYRLLEQLKLVSYLTYLTNCEELQQEDESFQKLSLIVARRLKLYQMVDARWFIKSCKITQNDRTENYTLHQSYEQIQSLLKQNCSKMSLFMKQIHVFTLTAMSYAFAEIQCLQAIIDDDLEVVVEEQLITHSSVLDIIHSIFGETVVFSCSITIFNNESDIQRFELLQLKPFKCLVELQTARVQESCDLLTTDTSQQIPQENRLLLAARSGDHISLLFLMDQIGKVDHEDIWLDSTLVHDFIDCSHMNTKTKMCVLEKLHTVGIQFNLRHPNSGQSAVALALQKGQLELSDRMITYSCENLTEPRKFIAIIEQGSIDVFKRFLSIRRLSDEEEFILISNALRELTVKHVYLSPELQTFLWYKLAKFGFGYLCTDSDTPKNPRSWMEYLHGIIENINKLKSRSDFNDLLGINNEVLYIFRLIHKQLFFIKDKPHLKNIPLKETTFLLAVFLSDFSFRGTDEHSSKSFAVYRMVLNKISLMQLLEFIAEQLTQFRDMFLNIIDCLVGIVPVNLSERNHENLQSLWDRERENNYSLPKLTNDIWNNLVSKRHSNLTPSNLVYTVLSSEPVVFTPNLSRIDNRRRKKLLKLFHRVKQLYSLLKILNILNQMSLNGTSKAVTVASMKRFLQIFGECIKNTPNSQNLPNKLNRILQQQLSGYINFVKQTRDVTCHDYPLAKKLLSLDDQFVYYSNAGNYLRMVKVTAAILVICTYLEYLRSLFGVLRQCRSLDQMRSLIRFVGSQDSVDSYQEDCMNIIIRYHSDLSAELKAIPIKQSENKETLDRLISNHDRRQQVVKLLQDVIQRFLYKFRDIQIAAFSTTSVETVHRFLDVNLLSTNNHGVLDLIENTWVVLPDALDKLSSSSDLIERSAASLTTLQINFDINQEMLQTFHCRDEVRKIVEELFGGTQDEVYEKQQLEGDLLSRLDRGGRGYFNNIFMIDSKTQAIKNVFRQKSIEDFARKLETIRARDVIELQNIFETKQQYIREVLEKYNCSSIELLIQNVAKIPHEATLAIEYWLLELCEILISTKQFRDNFFTLKYDLQMICGRNFRNYLAHDGLSYNLLTSSTHVITLINALVMVQKRWSLFKGMKLSSESNLMKTFTDGAEWLNEQKLLVQSVLNFQPEVAKRVIREGASITGKFWTVKGIFEGPSPVGLAEMLHSTKTKEFRTLGANIRKTCAVVDPFVQWDVFSSTAWNMEMALSRGKFDLAVNYLGNHSWGQWVKSGWFPQSVYPCLGALLSYLNDLNQHEEMIDILMCFGPDFLRAWICTSSEKFTDILLMKVPPALTEVLFHAILLHKSFGLLSQLTTSYDLFKSSALSAAVLANNVQYFDCVMKDDSSRNNTDDLNTIFEFCARCGRMEMLRIMSSTVELGQGVLNSALNISTQHRQWETVQYLLGKGADPWIRLKLNELSAGEIAIKFGYLRLTKSFLKLISPSYNKHSLLSMAARYGSVRMVKHLVCLGCQVWNDRKIMVQSMKNSKNSTMARFIESSIFDLSVPVPYANRVSLNGTDHFYADYFLNGTRSTNKQGVRYNKLHEWLEILNEYKVLNFFTALSASNEGSFIELLQFGCQMPKRILMKMMDFGKIDDEYFLHSIHFYDEGFEADEIVFELERKIRSIGPTNIQGNKEILFQYKNNTTSFSLRVLIDLFNSRTNLPYILQSSRTYSSHPTPSELCSDLIEAVDYHTESSALIAYFEFQGRAFYLIRVGSSSAIAEIRKAKSSALLYRLLNSTNSEGETVLHNVNSDTDIELLNLMIANGVDVSAVDRKGKTALVHMLTRQVQWDVLKHLLEYCALNDIRNNKEIHIFHMQDHEGQTLLYHAVSYARLRVVEFLLNHGVDQTVRDNSGRFPLYNAVLLRHTAIVYELVKHRSDVINLPHLATGDTPFSLAAGLNNVELVKMFLYNGADLGTRDKDGFTVVAKAIIKESCAALQVVLDYANHRGIDVVSNITPNQWNALQCTLMKDNVEIFRTVLEHMVGQSINSNMTEESLIKLKQIVNIKYRTIVELDVFEATVFHKHVNIRHYLRECETIYKLKMNNSLRNSDRNWLLDILGNNDM